MRSFLPKARPLILTPLESQVLPESQASSELLVPLVLPELLELSHLRPEPLELLAVAQPEPVVQLQG